MSSIPADRRRLPALALGSVGVLTLVPGGIHYLVPDGGAHVIAGLDLSQNGAAVVGVFAWMGATQIPLGLAQILIAWRHRSLVPLFLALALLQHSLDAIAFWITRVPVSGRHPPENDATLALLPLLAAALWPSLRPAPAPETGRAAPPGSPGTPRAR